MGLLDRFFGEKPQATEAKASTAKPLALKTTPNTANHMKRNPEVFAKEGYQLNPIVFTAIEKLANSAASVPLKLFKGKDEVTDHPILDLLKQPNPIDGGVEFAKGIYATRAIAGNSYILGCGALREPPRELYSLLPSTIKVVVDNAGIAVGYVQKLGNQERTYIADDVVHFKTFNPLGGAYGMPPMEAASYGVDTFNEGSRWNLSLIQQGGSPSGVLYMDSKGKDDASHLTDEQYSRLKQQLDDNIQGARNAGKPLLLEGSLKWQQMGMSLKDMDWAEGKNMTAREIALCFGVPPQLIGIPDSQTYANFLEARQSFWEDSVIPLVDAWLSELNRWLVPQFGEGLELRADLNEIPALEAKRQLKFDRTQTSNFLTINEKREALGYEKVGKEGDVILSPSTLLPLGFDLPDDEPADGKAASVAYGDTPPDDKP